MDGSWKLLLQPFLIRFKVVNVFDIIGFGQLVCGRNFNHVGPIVL
jgi:hypothetical protein